MKLGRILVAAIGAAAMTIAATGTSAPAAAPATTTAPARRPATFDLWTQARVKAALDKLEADGDFAAAQESLLKTFDTVVGYGTDKHLAAFHYADYGLRLALQLENVDGGVEMLKFLRKNQQLGRTLAFLISQKDDPKKVFAQLAALRVKHEKELETYAQLAAAICVVHDRPMTRKVNENRRTAADPVAIFEYYVANEKAMYFGVRNVPAELLIWVVDTTSSIEEMTWALKKYGRDDMVGKRFFDIKYDEDHFRKGTPKKVNEAGYSLPNILRYGGICADQAYFAIEVGKAIGVPTAYASGASAETYHAWVGFLEARGKQGWWNFDVGRYEEYKGVRGWVLDPQTREKVPDNYVSLMGELIGTTDSDRETTGAMTDAAGRLALLAGKGDGFSAELPEFTYGDIRKKCRSASAEGALELLEMGLKLDVGYPRGWLTVRDLAAEGQMTLEQKKRWSDIVLRLCGARYPDFALEILGPMIKTVSDVKEQDRLWTAAFSIFTSRADLAAEVRMNQAQMWLDHKDAAAAGVCFKDVIDRYCNAGPFILPALEGAENILRDTGKEKLIVTLYADTWKRTVRPKDMDGPFITQSNWYRVGRLLASKLREAGDERGAASVGSTLDGALGSMGK
jgi:hypothetical protein